MQGCANDFGKLIGKVAVLRMAFGCPDAVPALSEWKRLGAMTTKGIDYSMNTINSEADDAKGLVENLVNNMDLTREWWDQNVTRDLSFGSKITRSARGVCRSISLMKSRQVVSLICGCGSTLRVRTPVLTSRVT